MANSLVLLDESGDLGWILDKPYRQGGSSRYFTIGAAVGVNNGHRQFGKIVKNLRNFKGWTSKNEKKWANIGVGAQMEFARRAAKNLPKHNDIYALIAVVDKKIVPAYMHDHFHLLYSVVFSSLAADLLSRFRQVSVCPDELNAGVGSQNLIENILRRDIWFHSSPEAVVDRISRSSALEDGLAFCDFIAGAVWSHYEDGHSGPFNILSPHIHLHEMWKVEMDEASGLPVRRPDFSFHNVDHGVGAHVVPPVAAIGGGYHAAPFAR